VQKLMLLLMILSSLARADVAVAMRAFTSLFDVPSFVRMEPKYLNWLTSSSISPFIFISVLSLLALLPMIFDFSVLTSMPYALTRSDRLSGRFCSSCLLPPMRSMSSANLRLQRGLPPMEMEVWWFCSVSVMMFSRKKLKSTGEKAALTDSNRGLEELAHVIVHENCTSCVLVQCLDDFNEAVVNVELPEYLPEAVMPYLSKAFLKSMKL